MKCYIKWADGRNFVGDDIPESFASYEAAWEEIERILIAADATGGLPDNAFLVEDEWGNRYLLDEKMNHRLDIRPSTWARLRCKYGSDVEVITYWDLIAMWKMMEETPGWTMKQITEVGHFGIGGIYIRNEASKDEEGLYPVFAWFEDEVEKVWDDCSPVSNPIASSPTGREVLPPPRCAA